MMSKIFITKPITQVQINCEMNRALRKLESYEQKYIAVKNEKGYFKTISFRYRIH